MNASAATPLANVVAKYREHNDALERRLGITIDRSSLAHREREVLRSARLAGANPSESVVGDLLDACRALVGEP